MLSWVSLCEQWWGWTENKLEVQIVDYLFYLFQDMAVVSNVSHAWLCCWPHRTMKSLSPLQRVLLMALRGCCWHGSWLLHVMVLCDQNPSQEW